MAEHGHGQVAELQSFDDAAAAFARVVEIYDAAADSIRRALVNPDALTTPPDAVYPYVGISVTDTDLNRGPRRAYGNLSAPGVHGTTVTRPDLFAEYYREQFELVMRNHGRPLVVGKSGRTIPLTFVSEAATAVLTDAHLTALRQHFRLPDLSEIDDSIANGTHLTPAGEPYPLALFSAERVDYSLVRLAHYTATAPEHFQRFVLFTNYQRYVDEFIAYGQQQVANGDEYAAFVQPGNVVTPNAKLTSMPASGAAPDKLPQMPAYHLVREDREGITLINIGIGPSNAKTITDHVAVLRPHCWLMVGHCGGLRPSQRLGDYVLAHAYVRGDHVLDDDLPGWVPVPPIAELQIALTEAVAEETGLRGLELKTRLRTGTVFTTDNRNWELRHDELALRLNQSRAIAVDMESATIAANGYRFRVPYGTLLCVSDKPLHGEIKLPGMANAFYQERVGQHLQIGIAALRNLRAAGVESLHSRKLRSFDEPAFR